MRLTTLLISAAFALPVVIAACSDSAMPGEMAYDTLQDCYTDHVDVEHLAPNEAIAVCCLDHPIAGKTVICKDTENDCIQFVDAELDATATASDIMAGCTTYISEKAM